MSKKQRLAILQAWAVAIKESNAQIDALHKVTGMCDGPLIFAIWKLQDVLTDNTSALVGDESEWLDWYRSENDMGAKALAAGPKDKMGPIKNLKDLLWLIEG